MKFSLFLGLCYVSLCFSAVTMYETVAPVNIDLNTQTESTLTVGSGDEVTFTSQSGVFITIDITAASLSGLVIAIERPDGNRYTLVDGFTGCDGANINATFTEFAAIPVEDVFDKCDTDEDPLLHGFLRPYSHWSPDSGTSEGDWKLEIDDYSEEGGKVLNYWRIEFLDDFDADGVDNADDTCPVHFNPKPTGNYWQMDENMNGIGNECECEYSKHHTNAGYRKVCLYLENWGWNERIYKGQRKDPGDWAIATVPVRTFGTFQPGDYSHQNTWLDCDCDALEILP